MKKFLFTAILTLVATCAAQQQASAWINSKFSAGMNWNWASGGNTLGWGLFRDGQPGAPDFQHGCTKTPVYPQPTCCVGQATTVTTPQVFCPPGVGAPAGPGFAPPAGPYPANTNTQSLRYPSYRPSYPAAPMYPANYYRGH